MEDEANPWEASVSHTEGVASRTATTDSQLSVLTLEPAPLENHCTKFGSPSRGRETFLDRRMTRPRKLNSGWSSGKPPKVPAATPTEFELQAMHLGLTEQNYAMSQSLRNWCERNRDRCYVPEWLLKQWGMLVDPNIV